MPKHQSSSKTLNSLVSLSVKQTTRIGSFACSLGSFSVRNSLKKAICSHRTSSTISAASAMNYNSSCMLVLRGKSPAENKIAEALKSTSTLKLSDGSELSILLDSDSENPFKEGKAFGVDSFMKSLSTNLFGRFLLWSPHLPSTQDVVSENFCELPKGAVCVADVQYKGRGRSKNVWGSPKGCLVFSFTLQTEDGFFWSKEENMKQERRNLEEKGIHVMQGKNYVDLPEIII